MTHRTWGKPDANQNEIVDALLSDPAGFRVQTLGAVGAGCPDLLVSWGGRMWLLEVKMPGAKPNEMQKRWAEAWNTPVYVVHDVAEALAVVGGGGKR